jgi:DNA-binding response OmpR family regulator
MKGAPSLPVLLVEDDPDLAASILDYLEGQGWKVDFAPNGAMALHKLIDGKFAAGIFDLNLPGVGGLELCTRVRSDLAPSLPVLILTAADGLEDRLKGFQAGADDYLVKPFATAELLARLQAIIRRTSGGNQAPAETIRIGDLRLQVSTREAYRGARRLTLTNMGFLILQKLMQSSPAIVLRTELETHLWGDEPPGSDSLRTHIAHLRAAIEPPGCSPMLHTHRGVGFQILANQEKSG